MAHAFDPSLIPHHKKLKYLKQFSEDDFRDKVVRPLFLLQGLTHGKDTCGTDEEGKDCYFWQDEAIRGKILVAVQTKKGDLKLTAKLKDNLLTAITQVQTALQTQVYDSFTKQQKRPSYVVLAASGEINNAARRHIVTEVSDPQITFKDANDFIPEIDRLMPEFWNGIDADKLPYLKKLRDYLLTESVTIDISSLGLDSQISSPIADDSFTQIYVNRIYTTSERHGRETKENLEVEDIKVQDLLRRKERLVRTSHSSSAL